MLCPCRQNICGDRVVIVSGKPVVAVDMGGTKIAAGLVARSGDVTHRERALTMAVEGPGPVMQRLFAVIDTVLKQAKMRPADTSGICLAVASPIDMNAGVITNPPNLPGWDSVPLRGIVEEKYGINAFLINDAKAAALGEHEFGACKGVDNLICVTLGTGIGGGIITGGRLYLGQSGAAGEIGHMTVDINGPRCVCGNVGCWELFASGTAMEREATRRLEGGAESSLRTPFLAGEHHVKAEQIAAAARQGDPLAMSVVAWSADNIGTGLVNLANIFNPEVIVVGGGLSKIGALLLGPAFKTVNQRTFPVISRAVRLVPSTIGDDAAILGAAAFAFNKGEV
jgi:glucokinase